MHFELVGEGGEAEDSDCDENEAGGDEGESGELDDTVSGHTEVAASI